MPDGSEPPIPIPIPIPTLVLQGGKLHPTSWAGAGEEGVAWTRLGPTRGGWGSGLRLCGGSRFATCAAPSTAEDAGWPPPPPPPAAAAAAACPAPRPPRATLLTGGLSGSWPRVSGPLLDRASRACRPRGAGARAGRGPAAARAALPPHAASEQPRTACRRERSDVQGCAGQGRAGLRGAGSRDPPRDSSSGQGGDVPPSPCFAPRRQWGLQHPNRLRRLATASPLPPRPTSSSSRPACSRAGARPGTKPRSLQEPAGTKHLGFCLFSR